MSAEEQTPAVSMDYLMRKVRPVRQPNHNTGWNSLSQNPRAQVIGILGTDTEIFTVYITRFSVSAAG